MTHQNYKGGSQMIVASIGSGIVEWIQSIFGAEAGKYIGVIFISMLPIVELRGAIPVAYALGLSWKSAFLCSIIGNMIPVPFILFFINSIFAFMKKHNILKNMVIKFETKAAENQDKVEKYGFWGVAIFVGIPLPGTGAWTGALIAAVMHMSRRKSLLSAFLGVLIAAIVVTALTYGLVGGIANIFK
jgi:uncharacterized membrane protein